MNTVDFEPLSVTVPLYEDPPGVLRVGDSRVLLELVIQEFRNGAVPEEIVQAYDTLELSDVYAVLAWCLAHEDEVERYMRQCDEDAEAVRRDIETARPKRRNLREMLLARSREKEKCRASSGE